MPTAAPVMRVVAVIQYVPGHTERPDLSRPLLIESSGIGLSCFGASEKVST